jgi:sugar transferase (PEP-CTERM/EpsH1 system associated)
LDDVHSDYGKREITAGLRDNSVNILFLSTWFPYPPDNGSKIRAHYLLRAVAEKHEVAVVAFQRETDAERKIDAQRKIDQQYGDRTSICPVPVDPFRHVSASAIVRYASPRPLAFWPSRRMSETVQRVSAGRRWDAVVAVQTPVAQYALPVKGVPGVIDVDTALSYQMHNRYVHHSDSPTTRIRNWVSWQKAHQYEMRLFRNFRVCTLAGTMEVPYVSAMVRSSQTRVEVVPNGVDCQHNRPGLARRAPAALVFNGAMTYDANLDAMQFFLAEIYPQVRREISDVSLTITGKTTGVQLTSLHLDESVRLSGYVDDIRPFIAGSAACVVPLRQGGGTRLKILEAMALGTPVVSTTKGAEGLHVTPEHDILVADDPAGFARQVVRLLHDAALRERIATNARSLVEQRYDWQQIGRRFNDLVEEAARGRNARIVP